MQRIDSHHHFWNYSVEQYGWISDSMQVLRRDFGPPQLRTEIDRTHIDAVVSVQARQTIEETRFLLQQTVGNDWIRGVVGWVPLADPKVEAVLEQFKSETRLKGVRHVVQDEPDEAFLERPAFNAGVALLEKYDLVYDILIFAKQLPMTLKFVDRHPNQRFVLDHIAKPTIRESEFDAKWAENIRALAKRSNVMCKFSALVTEVRDPEWTVKTLRPYWDVVLEAFGANRLMFGSDWPVCLLRSSYADWAAAVGVFAEGLSKTEQISFWGGNATAAYKLKS